MALALQLQIFFVGLAVGGMVGFMAGAELFTRMQKQRKGEETAVFHKTVGRIDIP
jgi:hypothetical protein